MGTNKISKLDFINIFKEKKILLFNSQDLRKVLNISSENTLKHLIRRLKHALIIKRLAQNKYLFLHSNATLSDFTVANFLKIPSYISLESALSYYSLIDQFPYRITSIVLSRPKEIKVDKKIFIYSKIKKEYYKDFIKVDQFLIASKEKAIFDYLYFSYKGLKSKHMIEDIKLSLKDKKTISYLKANADYKFAKFLKRYVKL